MEKEKKNPTENENNTKEVERAKLSPAATVILTLVAALGMIVLFRIMYYFIVGA